MTWADEVAAGQMAERIAWYGAWCAAEEAAKKAAHERGAWPQGVRRVDNDRELLRVCARVPAGTPEPLIRAEVFAGLLRRAEPMVLPEFDLCGHWLLEGRLRRETLPAVIDEPARKACVAAHPQRSFWTRWDHLTPETHRFLAKGIEGSLSHIEAQFPKTVTEDERHFLQGMKVMVQAFSGFVLAHAERAEELGRNELAESLRHIALKPPRTYFEAIQLIWLRYVVFNQEGRGAMAFGRIDQHLYPFYKADLAAGRITRAEALDLLCQLRAFSTNVDNTGSTTVGGVDSTGKDASNEVTYLVLEAADMVRVPDMSLFARFHEKSPRRYLEACAKLILSGGGMPAMMNDAVSLKQLEQIGITGPDAFNHCFTGCAHLYVEGLQVSWTEAHIYLPPMVMDVLKEMRAKPEVGLTYDRLQDRLQARIAGHIEWVARDYNSPRFISSAASPDLFLSVFLDDCIDRRRECNEGGARYPGVIGLDIYGSALAADMLMAMKQLVFEEKRVGFEEVMAALDANYEGHEPLRQMLLNGAPKFGNDQAEVDSIAAQLVQWVSDACRINTPSLCDGSILRPIFPGTWGYVSYGCDLMATPDGRRAGEPMSDSGSPMAGRDKKGLPAMFNSLAKVDHTLFNGMALNVRINPVDFKGEAGINRFIAVLGVMRQKGLQELQFNCVTNELLREAQRVPEKHGNLLIRVAGYSARFVQLNNEIQTSIMAREQHSN
jgi:formate C-acetyltransferase